MRIKLWSKRVKNQLFEWNLYIGRKGKGYSNVYFVFMDKTVEMVGPVEYGWHIFGLLPSDKVK